jgi:hypothetical protein
MQTKRHYLAITILPLMLVAWSAAVFAGDFRSRDGGPGRAEMLANGSAGLEGLARVRPVLKGVLYRAGFSGGDKEHDGLSGSQRRDLCEAGFSGARYIDFGSHTHFGQTPCGGNRLDYQKGSSNHTRDLMRDIHDVIQDPGKGPILVHCMWGVHSSGAVSAMALMQFCGWSPSRAKAYWQEARNGAPCGSSDCGEWIDKKFARFKVDPGLVPGKAQQVAICPR